MKKSIKITLFIIGLIFSIIILDTLQARIFKNSPLISFKQNISGGYVDKGILLDTYYCIKDQDTINVSWHFKTSKFACPITTSLTDPLHPEDDEIDEDLLRYLEEQLGSYLVTENDNLIDIPLSDINPNNQDKIAYFKAVYASNHPDNLYVIVFPVNGTYDYYVMKDFDKYFYQKYEVYQKYAVNYSGITIYSHTSNNDIDFSKITNEYNAKNNNLEGKNIPQKTIDNLNKTNKIAIKNGDQDLGTINNPNKIKEIINIISNSKEYGNAFLCDGPSFEFAMYDAKNNLIDTISIWSGGKRILPASLDNKGCFYYSVSDNVDLRQIIEDETDYLFYNILDYRDNKETDYLSNEVLIEFTLKNQVMTLKYATDHQYISLNQVMSTYPDILKK